MKYKSKANNFNPDIDKEIIRFSILNDFINTKLITKDNILTSYSYKTTKYDPIVINYVNNIKLFDDDQYQKIINKINNVEKSNKTIIFTENFGKITLERDNVSYIISKTNYARIKSQIIDDSYTQFITFNELLWCLFNRYNFFGMLNGLSGSVLPNKYLEFGESNKQIFECFGSFLNHTSERYCGLFYDLEKYFGCVGNFFDTKFYSGLYFANPPFTVDMINKTCERISKQVNKHDKVTFLIIIPTWRIDDRKKLNLVCKTKLKTDYVSDVNLDSVIKNNKLLARLMYCKEDFPYFDFIDEKTKYFASTDLILIGNPYYVSINKINKIFPNAKLR